MEKTQGFVNVENEVVPFVSENSIITTGNKSTIYSSIDTSTKEGQKLQFNALSDSDDDIGKHINKKIKVKNIVATSVQITDEETGEIQLAPRIVFIDDKGRSYNCVSKGMLNATQSLIDSFGEPNTWDEPIEIEIIQKTVAKGTMFTFKLV